MSKYFERSFTIPCGEIQAKVWGKVGGRPVLGLHGWLDNANTFDNLAPMLPEVVHFVAIDLPGHGKSSHKPEGVSTYDWVIDIKRVVSKLGWKKFSMLSHSMSAEYSLLYAGAFPQEVEKLILLDGFVSKLNRSVEATDVFGEHAKAMLEEASPRKVYPDLPAITAKVHEDLQKSFGESEETAKLLVSRGVTQVSGGYVFSYDRNLRMPRSTQFRFYKNVLNFRIEDYVSFFKRITCDILIIMSNKFDWKKNFYNESKIVDHYKIAFDALKQNARVSIRFSPGNHYVHINNPKLIMPFVNSFLVYPSPQSISSKL